MLNLHDLIKFKALLNTDNKRSEEIKNRSCKPYIWEKMIENNNKTIERINQEIKSRGW